MLLTCAVLVLIGLAEALPRRTVKYKSCPNPGFALNGRRIGNDFRFGQSVRFVCHSGFKLRGSPVRTCLKNKQWSGSLAVCDNGNTDCPILGTPVSGIKIGNRYNFGSIVRFRCKQGYVLQGSSIRRCLSNGKWTGTEAKCIDEFYHLVQGVNDTALFLRKTIDTLLEYTCSGVGSVCNITGLDSRARKINLGEDRGLDVLFVFDASSSITQKEFKLAKQFARRIVKQLGATWKPKGTRIAVIVYGTTPKLEFNFGDHGATTKKGVIKKLKKVRKIGGATGTKAALEMARKTVFVEKSSKRQRVMFFITDGRSNIGGPPEKAANVLREQYRVKITAIGVGENVNIKELYAIAFNKKDVILVKNYKALADSMKKAITTTYDYSPCGENTFYMLGRIVGGTKAARGAWPWQVGIYTANILGEFKFKCGGALINKRWVLTAAHCFYVKKNGIHQNDNNPQPYTIIAGDFDRTIKEDSQQEIRAQGIFTHQNFNYSLVQNDIALVKLTKDAKLGPFVRAVCLPKSTKDNLLKPGSFGIVAGWGATQILHLFQRPSRSQTTSKVLLQSGFKIQSNHLCRTRTRYHFNSTVMFCAGDGKGGNDTCKGDSGGSFVRHVPRDDGTHRWVTAGLVSWGEGCGLKHKYGYYTKVAPFVDWIKKTMRSN